MSRVAVIQTKPNKIRYNFHFEYDLYHLCSKNLKKVLKKDVDISIDLEAYDWVILVGSEPLKYYTKVTSVMDNAGRKIGKFIPFINPGIVSFKPELKKTVEDCETRIHQYISGEIIDVEITDKLYEGIQDTPRLMEYLNDMYSDPCTFVAVDSETAGFDPRAGYVLGLCLSYQDTFGVYVDADCINTEAQELLQKIFDSKTVIMHNAKFDMAWLELHFGFNFPNWEDTMLIHYVGNETPGTHGLKQLAIRYTDYGNYEEEQNQWKKKYCRANGIKEADFRWEWIPFDVMTKYASMDAVVTRLIYKKFRDILKNEGFHKLYYDILKPAMLFTKDMEANGVPFDKDRLLEAQQILGDGIQKFRTKLSQIPEVREFEKEQGAEFNPGSPKQLAKILFGVCKLSPLKYTPTGAASTDVEVLEKLKEVHPLPGLILELRSRMKIKNTYVDKLIHALDSDGRLRTSFNIHTTRSGRLSSSGKMNMQNIPRDNPIVKGCIKARDGYKIVSMDLMTAEMYAAAVLSGDQVLQDVFRKGENFHSTIAHTVFNLDCAIEEVAEKYPHLRQAAKAISFGILYGAGAAKVAKTIQDSGINCSAKQAQSYINDYFATFSRLKEWIGECKTEIQAHGFIYSHFGRKRRLPDVKSSDSKARSKAVLSGFNFVVQSPASDINLLASIDMNNWLKENNVLGQIIALVHDSIICEVVERDIDMFNAKLKEFVQTDRGLNIEGCPFVCDFEIGDDYSFGKYEKFLNDINV